jgi:tetratricopeptide (TPR) repeat protein
MRIVKMLFWVVLVSFSRPSATMAAPDAPAALVAAKACKEQMDMVACKRAIHLGLSPKLASEVYTYWVSGGYGEAVDARGSADASATLRKAIKLDPQNALAVFLLTTYTGSLNSVQLEEQEKLLRRVIELRPDWDAPHARLASLLGPFRYEEAIREWQLALTLAPDDTFYRAALESLKKGQKEGGEKLAEMEAKAKEDPKNWAIQAASYAKFVCNVQKVEAYFAEFQKYFPDRPPILVADTYAVCGEEDKARKLYREILAGFEQRLDSGLTYNDSIQLSDSSLQSLGLLPELTRLRLLRATLCERDKNWYIAGVELERASWDAPSAELYARLAADKIKGGGMTGDIQSVVDKAVKLDPAVLERHPELKAYQKAEPKR